MVTMKELRSSAYAIPHPIKSIGRVRQTLTFLIHLMGDVFVNIEILKEDLLHCAFLHSIRK
jgi:hypothetical protein